MRHLKKILIVLNLLLIILFGLLIINPEMFIRPAQPKIIDIKIENEKIQLESKTNTSDKTTNTSDKTTNTSDKTTTTSDEKSDETDNPTSNKKSDETETKTSSETKDKTLLPKNTRLNSSNIYKAEDTELMLVKMQGINPRLVEQKLSDKTDTNKNNQIETITINLDQIPNLEKKTSDLAANEYLFGETQLYMTDYMCEKSFLPVVNQIKEWLDTNKRPVTFILHFEYSSENAKVPLYINLNAFTNKQENDIDIPLNLNLVFYNKDQTRKINYLENQFIE